MPTGVRTIGGQQSPASSRISLFALASCQAGVQEGGVPVSPFSLLPMGKHIVGLQDSPLRGVKRPQDLTPGMTGSVRGPGSLGALADV